MINFGHQARTTPGNMVAQVGEALSPASRSYYGGFAVESGIGLAKWSYQEAANMHCYTSMWACAAAEALAPHTAATNAAQEWGGHVGIGLTSMVGGGGSTGAAKAAEGLMLREGGGLAKRALSGLRRIGRGLVQKLRQLHADEMGGVGLPSKVRLSGKHPPISPRQSMHVDGTPGKSQFKEGIDADDVTRTAWEQGHPEFDRHGRFLGKRFTFEGPIGTSPQGFDQHSIFVHWSPKKGIHGVPTTVREP